MNTIDTYAMIKKIYEENQDEYEYIGLRFEDKDREIGDICENSKHNPDRDDERDFPVYGSEEYEDLPELNGTSAWDMNPNVWGRSYHPGMVSLYGVDDREFERYFSTYHCYVIASNKRGYHDDPDDGEILIKDAVVIAKIF